MQVYAGLDLHSNNTYEVLMDREGKVIHKTRLPNDLAEIAASLEPFRDSLQGIAVESTFNWYWLVDGLMDEGFPVKLANPAAIKQYKGTKFRGDAEDAANLADLLRMDRLPTGYIYPKETRQIRDLLRKRIMMVQQRTSLILSLKGIVIRNTGKPLPTNDIHSLREKDLDEMLQEPFLAHSAKQHLRVIQFITKSIKDMESLILKEVRNWNTYQALTEIPGIGIALGLTIALETGDIERFEKVGNYVSYCRCVRSVRISNEKSKGRGNDKNGNRYLAWAFIESHGDYAFRRRTDYAKAANFAIRYDDTIKRYYQRKEAKTKRVVALKAVAHKLCRACYHMMKEGTQFDVKRAFGS